MIEAKNDELRVRKQIERHREKTCVFFHLSLLIRHDRGSDLLDLGGSSSK